MMEYNEWRTKEKELKKKANYRDNSNNIKCCFNCKHFIFDRDREYGCDELSSKDEDGFDNWFIFTDELSICDKYERKEE